MDLLKLADELDRLKHLDETTADGEPDNMGESWHNYAGHLIEHHDVIVIALRNTIWLNVALSGLRISVYAEMIRWINDERTLYPDSEVIESLCRICETSNVEKQKVWVVTGDDHDYDQMSQWLVGVYSTEDKAKAAAEKDRKAYRGHLKGGPNYEILAAEVDGEARYDKEG